MTFDTAAIRWRNDVLVDDSSDWYANSDGLNLLRAAAVQISDGLRLLRGQESRPLQDGDMSVAAPSDMLAVQPLALSIGGSALSPAAIDTVRSKQMMGPSRYPRYYHYDPGDGSELIEFGPALKGNATALLRYHRRYDEGGISASDEIWEGAYPAFHHLVILLAGVTTYQGLELYERANYFAQRFNEELQKFAAVLGQTDIANLMVPPEQRHDPGRVSA